MERHASNRGSVLIMAIISTFVMAALATALFTNVVATNDQSLQNRSVVTADFLAEGAAEMCEKILLRNAANHDSIEPGGILEILGNPVDYEVGIVGPSRVATGEDGMFTLVRPVSIRTRATRNGFSARVNRVVEIAQVPIFQWAVFYDRDLEILPGPNMTLTGRVHSNRDIYLACGGTLTIDSNYLRAAGDVFRLRKDNGAEGTGTVRIRNNGTSDFYVMENQSQLEAIGIPSDSGFDSAFVGYDANGDGDYIDGGELSPWVIEAIERWGGTVQTAVHGMRELVPPSVKSIQRYAPTDSGTGGDYEYDANTGEYYEVPPGTGSYEKGYFHKNAGLIITEDGAIDANGRHIDLPPGIVTERSMYDAREKKWIDLTQIDLALLGASGVWPENGLLYAVRTDAAPGDPNSVRLVNGSELVRPLTVVSEGPVFTMGDYNVVNKKPAAIICDAYNLLSNAWDDSKIAGSLPSAARTFVAAAIITGNYETRPGVYNGGFENLVRFHENWSDVVCAIRGSFVNLYDSRIATGAWYCGGDVYSPPIRNWDFDPALTDPSNLPPYTPIATFVRQVAWW